MIKATKYDILCKCGGKIGTGVEIYVTEDKKLVILGICDDCLKAVYCEIELLELMCAFEDNKNVN